MDKRVKHKDTIKMKTIKNKVYKRQAISKRGNLKHKLDFDKLSVNHWWTDLVFVCTCCSASLLWISWW